MRLPHLFAASLVAILNASFVSLPTVPAIQPTLRTVTPTAPPEWHPNRAAIDALPGLDGDGTERIRGLASRSALVYDADADRVLFDRRADDPYPVASLTKLVASLALASTNADLERVVCVDDQFRPSRSGARSRMQTGDCYRGWDLLGATLVSSDNRAAFGLQVTSGLDYSAFIGRMDDVARDLGMSRSSFADPSGLEDENLSTARDMARAVVAVAAHPTLSVAANATHWHLDRVSGTARGPSGRLLRTTDRIASTPGLDVLAAKTGYSDTAGYCFATMVRTASGRTLVITLLGAGRNSDRWSDVRRILDTFGR